MEINSPKTHSGVIRLPVNRAELIIQRTLNGLLSRTIMFDGELMRKFFNHCEAHKSLLWWHAHTREQASKHTPVFSFPFTQARTHTHTPDSLLQRLTFPSHTSTLFCSAQLCVDQGSCLGYNQLNCRWRTLNPPPRPPPHPLPSICYSIPRVKHGVEKNMPSPLRASCVIGKKKNPRMISKRPRREKTDVAASFCTQSQICARKNNACFIAADELSASVTWKEKKKRTTAGAVPNSWGIVCRDVEY